MTDEIFWVTINKENKKWVNGMKNYISEASFAQEMQTRVQPVLEDARQTGTFKGCAQSTLCFVRYDAAAPNGTVLILHGLNESTEKYREMIYYFLCAGLSVLIFDQRGHGYSHRTAPKGLVHADHFDDYVNDAICAVQGPLATCQAPYFLFAHSMGGAVAALLLEKEEHPFRRAVLSSPMIRIFRYPHMPPAMVSLACRVLSATGFARKGVPMRKKHKEENDFTSSCALSRARFDAYSALKRQYPAYACGTVTFGWAREAIGVTKRILAKGAPEHITIPVRIYSAERDHLVENTEQQELASRIPNGEFISVAGAKHEIYMSSDNILYPYLNSLLDFLCDP